MEGNEVKLHRVVSLLVTDVNFVENWKTLHYELSPQNIDIVSLDNQRKNGTLNISELLMQILTSWISFKGTNATVQVLHNVLTSNEFISLAEKLQNRFSLKAAIITTSNVSEPEASHSEAPARLNTISDVPHWFEVRQQAPKFTGRVDELTKLDKFCTNNDKLILVAGMGGIGKSQLVVYFATQFYNDRKGSVIWLQGQNENSFIESIERLTGCKKPKQYSEVEICAWISTALKAIHAKLKTNPTLIIIDNVDQRNFLVEFCIKKTKSLPPKNLPIILVTSRKKDILGGVVSCILNLEVFDPYTAVKFVLDSLEGESDNTAVDLLCKRLQYFPLALGQAVAYIQMKRQISVEVKFRISDYLRIIESQKIELLGHKLNEIESDYNFTVLTTWNVTLESIKSQGEVGIAAANILQLLAYCDLKGIYMHQLKRLYFDSFDPHYENAKKHVNDAIELLRSYSMCNIQHGWVSMHFLLQEVIRLQNLMQSNTTLFKSVITTRNWITWGLYLPILWYDCFKSDSFVRENVEMLYDCCVEIFRESFGCSFKKESEMVEECNKAIIRVLGKESQEVFVNRKCIPHLKESNTNKYTSAVLIYLDIKDVLDKDKTIAKRFAYINNRLLYGVTTLQKYKNDKQIPITEIVNFYKFSVRNAKKKHACLELTKWVVNFLCLELNTEKLHEIQYFLCDFYYKNKLEKRTLLTFLKCIEVGIQVIKGDNRCYDEFTCDFKEAVEGICSYSKQIKHQYLVENTRLFFQEDADFSCNLLKYYMYPWIDASKLHHTFPFLQNLDQVFIDDYSKEVYDPEKMERSVHILSENLRSNKVCHIDACFVANIMLAVDNLNGNQLHPAATAILLEINNKPYRLFDKFLSVVKYDKHLYCEIEVVSKIDYIRRLPIVQHSTEHSVLIDAPRTLLGYNKDSKGLILNSVNFDKDFNIKNIESSTKQKINCASYFGNISDEEESDCKLDLNDVLTVENGLFVWKRKQRESNCKVVFDKMKKAVLQDFELAVIAAIKTVKQSTDGNFRYETFWCAARLLYFKIKALRNLLSPETKYEASDKMLDFLDECLSLTETDTERYIFQSTINWCIFSYVVLGTGYLKIPAFLIYLRYSELNIVLINKILKDSKSEELSKFQLEVFKLIEQNLIRLPQNGYQVIKLNTLKLIKQGNFRFSLSKFRMAASSNLNDKNLAQVIQNENEKLFFIQTINKKLSLSNWNESEIPVDLSIALFYHMILAYDSMQEETLLLLEKILIFLEENNEFSEMVKIGRNTKKILAFAKPNKKIDPNFVISKITYILDKAGKKYMIMRLQKPIRTKKETEEIET